MSHLEEVNETYWQHFKCAIRFSGILLRMCIVCAVHSLFPELFKTTASTRLSTLLREMNRSED